MDSTKYVRSFSSISLLDEADLVVTGTQHSNERFMASCEIYRAGDGWTSLPFLNQGRFNHSSCIINKKIVFVFGGE